MPGYIDSSVVLSLLFKDAHFDTARELWGISPDRVSSILIRFECLTVLRRVPGFAPNTFQTRVGELNELLSGITLKMVDQDVWKIFQETPRISGCRSLDAIHLATALFFKEYAGEKYRLLSLDKRLLEVAQGLKIATC